VDEITIHPRDNAMIVATHGRAIWVLDHLAPVQEYAAAQKAMTDAALFSPAPAVMYRRPARDRNYEFWGDQTFFGENPPQAAVITWTLKKDAGTVALKIADSAGREVREISGPVLASYNKAGINSACWDLRVQPAPQPAGRGNQGQGRGGQGQGQGQGGPGGGQQQRNSFGAGCGGGGGGGFGGGGGGNAGPYVLPGAYTVSLVVDGKTVDSKPLRVTADPEVVLTDAERRKLFDMAMEMHDLQKRGTEVANSFNTFNTRLGEIGKELESKSDIPADVKSMFEAVNKEAAAMAPKFAPPAGGRGGGRGGGGGAADSPLGRAGAAKNGMMGGMWPAQSTFTAYNDAKGGVPKLFAEANALFTKATALSSALAKHNITLTVPSPASLKPSSSQR